MHPICFCQRPGRGLRKVSWLTRLPVNLHEFSPGPDLTPRDVSSVRPAGPFSSGVPDAHFARGEKLNFFSGKTGWPVPLSAGGLVERGLAQLTGHSLAHPGARGVARGLGRVSRRLVQRDATRGFDFGNSNVPVFGLEFANTTKRPNVDLYSNRRESAPLKRS